MMQCLRLIGKHMLSVAAMSVGVKAHVSLVFVGFFFFQAEDGIRYLTVTGVQTCALPISWIKDFRWIGAQILHAHHVRRLARRDGVCQPLVERFGCRYSLVHGAFEVAIDVRSEEHTSELQSQSNLVCRLLLETQNRDTSDE